MQNNVRDHKVEYNYVDDSVYKVFNRLQIKRHSNYQEYITIKEEEEHCETDHNMNSQYCQ
jgi:hypothetical protein